MPRLLRSFINDTSGATAVEYGLMAALIALVIIASVALLGEAVRDLFSDVAMSDALTSE
jgi:pilus assembly protein Flp/PilA